MEGEFKNIKIPPFIEWRLPLEGMDIPRTMPLFRGTIFILFIYKIVVHDSFLFILTPLEITFCMGFKHDNATVFT